MSLLRWDSGKEFDDQYVNYQVKKRQFRVDGSKTLATSMQMLMDHINSNHALHAEVHWGTLRLSYIINLVSLYTVHTISDRFCLYFTFMSDLPSLDTGLLILTPSFIQRLL